MIQKLNSEIGGKLEDWYRYVESSHSSIGGVAANPQDQLSPSKTPRGRRRFRFSAGASEQPVASGNDVPVPAKETREELLARLLDPVLTLDEAAQVLNVCPTTVRRYTNRGLLEHHRTIGNQRRFRLSHVLALLARMGSAGEDSGAGTLSSNTAALLSTFAGAGRIEASAGTGVATPNS